MPIQDMDPGTSPEAPGNWYFYAQGQGQTSGVQFDTSGNATFSGTVTASNVNSAGTIVISTSRTADAGTAINQAIATLPSTGGTVLVPAGTWTIDTPILISKNGIILQGVSQAATSFHFDATVVSACIQNADTTQRYCAIRDLQILTTASASTGAAIDASYFVNSIIQNVRIGGTGNNPQYGVKFNVIGSYYNVVRDCRISVSGVGSRCISFDNTSNSNVVDNCRLVGDSNTVGVYVNSHAIEINRVDCESTMSIGIQCDTLGHDCTIISPYLEAISTGVQLESGVEATTIVGGVIINCVTANITDNGAKGFNIYNTRLQFDPYSRLSVWNSAFSNSYPLPGNYDTPQDHGGCHAWSLDPAAAVNSSLLTNGTIYLARVRIQNNVVGATKLWYQVATVATTPTAGQNWIGLYDSSGNRLAQVGIDSGLGSTGPTSATIPTTNLAPGYYYIAFLCNAATAVTLARAGGLSASGNSFNQTNSNLRWAVNGTLQTTLPSTLTLSSNSVSGSVAFFTAVS